MIGHLFIRAIAYSNPRLEQYATTLATQIEEFDLENLPNTVKSFPNVRRSLERRL